MDALYEGNKGSYEIEAESGMGDDVLDEDGKLRCTVTVEFPDSSGINAIVLTECKDEVFATNVRACIQNVTASIAPIPTR